MMGVMGGGVDQEIGEAPTKAWRPHVPDNEGRAVREEFVRAEGEE